MAGLPPEELPGPSPLLDENLVLRAGAGTGKTHALVTLALQLLAGLRRKGPVPADQLWLLTFTDKAAAELRGRLQQRLRRLAAQPATRPSRQDPEAELELWTTADHLGLPFPSPRRWAELLEASAGCRVTTLHGAGAALLRELPGGPGSFRLWDEAESGQALQAAARAVALAPEAPSEELLEDMRLNGRGPRDGGLVGALVSLHRRLAEDGLQVTGLSPPRAPASVGPALLAWRTAFQELLASGQLKDPEPTRRALALGAEVSDPEGLAESWDVLEAANRSFQSRGEAKKAARAAHEALGQAVGEIRAARLWEASRTLYAQLAQRYREAKQAAFALDFADLCSRARDLLRDDLLARRVAKEKVGALLLDETQDTNRVQLDLCLLLCERRGVEQPFAPGEPLHERVEIEPGTLCAVGDRKQSIYEFRGADVAVFERLASRVRDCGGRELPLQMCRRSRPELVDFYNGLFARAMAHGARDFEIRFDADDRLTPLREAAGEPLVELIRVAGESSGDQRRAEAEALARRTVQLLERPPAHLVAAEGGLRPGHVALLFRRLTHVEIFREAFREHGLPSAVAGGDGYYEVQEVRDAAALLALCADPDDGRALLTLLRSPLCGVLDATAARLALTPGIGLSLRQLGARRVQGLPGIPDDEAALVEELADKLVPLADAAEQLGPAALFDAAEQALGLRSLYRDAQAAANLDKLRGQLVHWEREGTGVAAAADRLARFARGEGEAAREPQASGFDDASLGAVRMLTVHQAKGLQFPVVLVPDCGFVRRPDVAPVAFARDEGLGVKARGPDGKWMRPPAYDHVQEALYARQQAESLRLLYVAATRAQERLIFSGEPGPSRSRGSWRGILDGETALIRIDGGALPDGRYRAAGPESHGDALAALSATEPLAAPPPRRLPLAATAVADLLLCPRRFQLRQLWRLLERPGHPEPPEEIPETGDPRQLGSRAHELLEIVDLPLAARDPEAAVERALEQLVPAGGCAPGAPKGARPGLRGKLSADDRAVAREVAALLASPFGRRVCALPPGRVQRELPFVLRAGPLVVRGAIDLLCLLDDCVLVVDYKRGPPTLKAGYRAQVDIYALAASKLVAGGLPIEGALWYLGEAARGPRRWPVGTERLAELSRQLSRAGAEAAGRPAGHALWPGLEPAGCEAIDCGYLRRCHRP